jgi:hypothetical protein
LESGSLSNQRQVNTRARYLWAIGGAAILAGEEEAGDAGSKDHWTKDPLAAGTGCGELRNMSEAQSDMPCTPAADGPLSSSGQMARNDEGNKLQALEALQCDRKWLPRPCTSRWLFTDAGTRSCRCSSTRAEQDYSHQIATTSLDLSRYSSPPHGQAPERAGPSPSASREREACSSSCLSRPIQHGNGDDVQGIASSSSHVHQ